MSNSHITYQQIKEAFTPEDFARYDALCREMIALMKGKSRSEMWDMVQPPSRLREVLDEVHAIRQNYDFLKGEIIFRVWTPNLKEKKMDELSW